jgi:hypothetical protein
MPRRVDAPVVEPGQLWRGRSTDHPWLVKIVGLSLHAIEFAAVGKGARGAARVRGGHERQWMKRAKFLAQYALVRDNRLATASACVHVWRLPPSDQRGRQVQICARCGAAKPVPSSRGQSVGVPGRRGGDQIRDPHAAGMTLKAIRQEAGW